MDENNPYYVFDDECPYKFDGIIQYYVAFCVGYYYEKVSKQTDQQEKLQYVK